MSQTFYSPDRQFRRALAADWQLFSTELLYGVPYIVVGFYALRWVGTSQVYNVTWPFVFAAGLAAWLTVHICSPSIKRKSALYFFALPQNRQTAFNGRLAFLFILVLWLVVLVFVGCGIKLGGAGITACYRIPPEFVVLPFLTTSAVFWGVHCLHSRTYWFRVSLFGASLVGWLFWKLYAISRNPANAGNNYWPGREMPLGLQFVVAGLFVAISVRFILSARTAWRKRQMGAVQ